MARRIIDLSNFLENDVPADPPPMRPQIKYLKHEDTVDHILPLFAGLKAEDLPGGGYAAANRSH
jgi:hypothetical protein